jgi:hypothetical protein
MSSHSDTLTWFRANQSFLFLLNTNFKVFGLTRSGLEPTIYRTRDEHANYCTTDAVTSNLSFPIAPAEVPPITYNLVGNSITSDNNYQQHFSIEWKHKFLMDYFEDYARQ